MSDQNNQNQQAQGQQNQQTQSQQNNNQNNQNQQAQPPAIDYEKITQMLKGTLTAKEDTALKAYFKQQGLSQEEAEQAMKDYKQKKAESEPNIEKLQSDIQTAQQAAFKSQIENKALMLHEELGVDLKTIPYIIKLADLSSVASNGTIDDAKLKEALEKVLTDVPSFKQQKEQNQQGFRQVGAPQQNNGQQQSNTNTSNGVATKRWNRFN